MPSNIARYFVHWTIENWHHILVLPLVAMAGMFTITRDHFHGTRSYTLPESTFIVFRSFFAAGLVHFILIGLAPVLYGEGTRILTLAHNWNLHFVILWSVAVKSEWFFRYFMSDEVWTRAANKISTLVHLKK